MIPAKVGEALSTLAGALAENAQTGDELVRYFRAAGHAKSSGLSASLLASAEVLEKSLPAMTRAQNAAERLAGLFGNDSKHVAFAFCAGTVERSDVRLAPLLAMAVGIAEFKERAVGLARDRVVQGPLSDAILCAPLLGRGDAFRAPENSEARARLEILVWEAGASALSFPELGPWLWGSRETFDTLVREPAKGSLRGRVLAARLLEVAVPGMPNAAFHELLGDTLQVLQPLLLHPEPLVWTHAARALGLLSGKVEHLEAMLLDWLGGDSVVFRERGMTAFSSLPAARVKALKREIVGAVSDKESEGWALAAASAGTPYLFQEARDIWDPIAARILEGGGGPTAARELARGLSTLWRGGQKLDVVRTPFEELRRLARRARPESVEEWRDYLQVLALTDPVDGAERDPLDLELGIENLIHLAAQYDDEEADCRAARFAETLGRTFEDAMRITLSDGSPRRRASAMNALEGAARSLALRLWAPQLATHPRGEAVQEPDMSASWELVANAPKSLLAIVKERRQSGAPIEQDIALEVLAIRLGGYALDACGDDEDLGPGRGPTAHNTCLWLSQLEGIRDSSRDFPPALRSALSSVFWRLVDTTRGSALGEIDDIEWLGPFAGWWSLVIDQPTMLKQLATAIPVIRPAALERCAELADAIRKEVASGGTGGAWGESVAAKIKELKADGTELAEALLGLAQALGRFAPVSGRTPDLENLCLELVLASERLQDALADPVRALHPAVRFGDDSLSRRETENAPRIANLVARSIRIRELTMLDVWFTSLGPVASALVEGAVRDAVGRTPPPPPSRKKLEPEVIEGYELVKPLGEGGIGKVWLVRRQGADRLFVLKIPKVEALAAASDTERVGILESFVEEAKALAGLYHPNVLNIIDRGLAGPNKDVPFMVLELLIGADLQVYSQAKPLSLFELRQIIHDSCAGLSSLHGAGLVHRDIKPANIWLRLPLAGGEKFDPQKHRDPAVTRPLSGVVIDFGMVRPMRVAAESAGRFVAGTPGYIAPDQVLDPVELDGRADVYALAGTIFNVTTGRTFFDEITNPRDRIFAHMQKQPLEDPGLLQGFPAQMVKLLRAATALSPKDRPQPMEFARAFEAAL